MRDTASPSPAPRRRLHPLLLVALLLGGILAALFYQSFSPRMVVFSNDGPLGGMMASLNRMPEGMTGIWHDLNYLGSQSPTPPPSFTSLLRILTSVVGFAKIFAPASLFLLGLCAAAYFRGLKLSPLALVLGGLAAALNSSFFSASCWGVASQSVAVAMIFLALAALADVSGWRGWLRVALAGLAVGLAVTEGYDLGAIFSLYVAAFLVFQAVATPGGEPGRKALLGIGRVAVVAAFAAFIATQTISTLVRTQITGIATAENPQEAWNRATQWSLPKVETLGVVVPGLFGYRMDTPNGGNYWGAVGRDPSWDRFFAEGQQGQPPGGFLRYTGGGFYAGILVILIAVWTVAQSRRPSGSPFDLGQRRHILFWAIVAGISLLFALGRFAPFYAILHPLPFFSSIRNPVKFVHLLSWALVILFAYGVDALSRQYLAAGGARAKELGAHLREWWSRAPGFDRAWTRGMWILLGVAVLGWMGYASKRGALASYLQTVQFDKASAQAIASFSVAQVGGFVLLLAAAVGVLTLVLSGAWSGRRALFGGLLLGALLTFDLGRANLPWILHWDYREKYATNPVIDLLREQPHRQRVALLPFRAPAQLGLLEDLYRIEWAQHLFHYYDVQSLDLVQMPRMPADMVAFETALQFRGTPEATHRATRRWELTNTRYLLGAAGFLDPLNTDLDPGRQGFKIAARFEIVPKPGIANPTRLDQLTAQINTNGPYALFEFTGALPRAKLYPQWQVVTNDSAALQQLAAPAFKPDELVLVAGELPAPAAATNPPAGTVDFVRYTPKRILLKAQTAAASVLLLNDRYDPNWEVTVDGRPAPLLRCNYIMRGVHLPPGEHQVEFRFSPPTRPLWVSLAAAGSGLLLLGALAAGRWPAARNARAA